MSKEENNHSRQDSGREKSVECFELDRQKVHDFFLSLDSGKVGEQLTGERDNLKEKVVKEDKSLTFFLPE